MIAVDENEGQATREKAREMIAENQQRINALVN